MTDKQRSLESECSQKSALGEHEYQWADLF